VGGSVSGRGFEAGTTLFDDTDSGPWPEALVALTENEYVAPFFSPATVIGLSVPFAVLPPGNAVTV
jgi:hypothetical protein